MIGKYRRALRRAHARNLSQILDRDGQAAQKPALAHRLRHQLAGMGACAVETQGWERIHSRIDLSDPVLKRIEKIERRDLT